MSASTSASPGFGSPVESGARTLRVVWSVSRAALARVRSDIRSGPGVADVTLEIALRADGSAETILRSEGVELSRERHTPGGVGQTRDPALGIEHIDIEGVVSCTLRGSRVLFARTSVLGRLGIEGGRYELASTKDAER